MFTATFLWTTGRALQRHNHQSAATSEIQIWDHSHVCSAICLYFIPLLFVITCPIECKSRQRDWDISCASRCGVRRLLYACWQQFSRSIWTQYSIYLRHVKSYGLRHVYFMDRHLNYIEPGWCIAVWFIVRRRNFFHKAIELILWPTFISCLSPHCLQCYIHP